MNQEWRQPEADMHEAKAVALEVAIAALAGVRDAVSTPVDGMIGQTLVGLQHEADAHRQKAKLLAA